MLKFSFKQWLARRSEKTVYPPVLPIVAQWSIRENKLTSNYYVYLHRTLDGTVFYVGKGINKRAWSRASRSQKWKEVASSGYLVELHTTGLSNKAAIELENNLIENFETLVNRGVQRKIETDCLKEYFKVDPASYSGISRIRQTWTGVYFSGKIGPSGRLRIEDGECLGWRICHKGKTIQAHRLVWEFTYGGIPDGYIVDHKDGDPTNNNPSNLRVVLVPKNTRNRKKSSRNTSGVTGVRFVNNGYEAQATVDGKTLYSRFGVKKYGAEAFRLACEWRTEQIKLLNEQGAGYTERHGK